MAQAGVIRDFMVALGFKTDNAGLGKMQDAMKGVELKAVALRGALLSLATGAVAAVKQTASELDKLYFSSQRIGASVTNINAYGNAIAQMGGSAEGAIGSLESLAEKMRNSPGYEGMINSLGVQTKDANGAMRDRVEVMKDLSGVLSKMPAHQANAYASSLGIDQNTLLAMRDGKFVSNMDKYQKIQKELGMNDDLAKSGNEFMTEYRDLTMITKTGFQVLVMQAGKALIPILKLLNTMIQAGIHAFSQLNPHIKEGLAIGLRFALLAVVFGGFIKTFGMIFKFIPMLKGFIGLLKLFRLAFLASPIGIIIALASALALLYDDYKTWKEGGKSLIDWSKWTNGIEKIIGKIKEFLAMLDKIKDKVINFVQKVVTDPAGAVKDIAEEAKNALEQTKEKAKETTKTAVKDVKETTKKAAEVAVGVAKVTRGLIGGVIGKNKAKNRLAVYNAFLNAGFSKNQALALTAEVGRENEYNSNTMFGTHTDLGNAKSNLGFFSWQGSRKKDLVKYLKSKNLIDKSGHMKKNQASLNAMAVFAKKEIESTKRYSKTKNQFLANPNINPEAAAPILGKNYIVWAYGQNYVNKGRTKFDWKAHDNRRRGNLNALRKQIKDTSESKISSVQNTNSSVHSFAPPNGNPHKSQVNRSNTSASNVTIHQTFKTDMTLHGVRDPIESANAVKRQQENSLVFMARGAQSVLT